MTPSTRFSAAVLSAVVVQLLAHGGEGRGANAARDEHHAVVAAHVLARRAVRAAHAHGDHRSLLAADARAEDVVQLAGPVAQLLDVHGERLLLRRGRNGERVPLAVDGRHLQLHVLARHVVEGLGHAQLQHGVVLEEGVGGGQLQRGGRRLGVAQVAVQHVHQQRRDDVLVRLGALAVHAVEDEHGVEEGGADEVHAVEGDKVRAAQLGLRKHNHDGKDDGEHGARGHRHVEAPQAAVVPLVPADEPAKVEGGVDDDAQRGGVRDDDVHERERLVQRQHVGQRRVAQRREGVARGQQHHQRRVEVERVAGAARHANDVAEGGAQVDVGLVHNLAVEAPQPHERVDQRVERQEQEQQRPNMGILCAAGLSGCSSAAAAAAAGGGAPSGAAGGAGAGAGAGGASSGAGGGSARAGASGGSWKLTMAGAEGGKGGGGCGGVQRRRAHDGSSSGAGRRARGGGNLSAARR
ncbi:NADPH oxidase respiratory burst oxidase [Gracilaria domingensis]|nr:NADPH oxidase respiratory burst oxidase [Gracilaria domingensis]